MWLATESKLFPLLNGEIPMAIPRIIVKEKLHWTLTKNDKEDFKTVAFLFFFWGGGMAQNS